MLDLFVTGTYAVTMSVFWFANFFLLMIEITKWPKCLIKYKIQEEPVNEASELEPNSLSKLKNSDAEELNAWSRQMKLLRLYTNESYSCQRQVEYYKCRQENLIHVDEASKLIWCISVYEDSMYEANKWFWQMQGTEDPVLLKIYGIIDAPDK